MLLFRYGIGAKFVNSEEANNWKSIEPLMMSDEENDELTLKRRRPDWRSQAFNKFMDELDERAYRASKHPRKVQVFGTPLKCPHPENVQDWMLNQVEERDGSPELCSTQLSDD